MKISVIVCTHNRAHAIVGCLESIAAALTKALAFDAEIIVVDNASEDDTKTVVEKWDETSAFDLRLVFEPRKGLAGARNLGMRTAGGDLFVFTDDDCRLSKNYIVDLQRYVESDPEPVLRGGRVELGDPLDLPLTFKNLPATARWQRETHFARNANLLDGIRGCNMILGCNMTMRREIAFRVGVFDEKLGAGAAIPASEDTDYLLRAYFANVPIEYVPDMAVLHFHGRKHPLEGQKLLRNYMIGNGALYAKYLFRHPGLCRSLYWDIRNAVREIISNKSTYRANIGFSHKHKVFYSMLGSLRYLIVTLRLRLEAVFAW